MKESLPKTESSMRVESLKSNHPINMNEFQDGTFPSTSIKDSREIIDQIRKDLGVLTDDKLSSVQTNVKNSEQPASEQVTSLEKKNYRNLSDLFLDSITPEETLLSQITKKQLSKNEHVYALKTVHEGDTYDFSVHASKKSLWLDYLYRNGTVKPANNDRISTEFMKIMSRSLQQMLLYCAQQQLNIMLVQFAAFKGDKPYDSLTKPAFAKKRAEQRAALFIRLLGNALGKNKTSVVFEKDLFQRMPNAIIYDMYLKDEKKYKQYFDKFKNLFNSFLHV